MSTAIGQPSAVSSSRRSAAPSARDNHGLKICIASSGLGHVRRGVEAWAEDLGHALAERGEHVMLCKGAGRAEMPYERVVPCWTRNSPANRRVFRWLPHALGWRLGLGSGYGLEQTTFAFNLIRLLRQQPVDILHVQDPQLALLMQRARHMRLCSARTILGHVTEEPTSLLRRVEYLQHVAPWHQAEALVHGAERPASTMIPNFIDMRQFTSGDGSAMRMELAIPPEATVLLVASAIKKAHKRVDYLIDEVAQLLELQPDLPLVLVIAGGREHDTAELVQYGTQRLGDRVRFLVQFPRNRMPELYRMAELLIHGSLFEMFGTVLLEAMASRVPCIVHHHPVMSWVVGPGGMALDLSQRGALTGALRSVLNDPRAIASMQHAARQQVCQKFSHDVVVAQFLQYYQRVIESAPV